MLSIQPCKHKMRYSGGPAESAAYRLPWRLRPSLHSISNGETIGMDLRFADQVHQLLPLIGRLAAFHLPREQKTALMLYWCPRFESGCTSSTKQKNRDGLGSEESNSTPWTNARQIRTERRSEHVTFRTMAKIGDCRCKGTHAAP